MSAIPLSELAGSGRWQEDFLRVLPAIKTHAAIRFRKLPASAREEATAEMIAVACTNYQRLAAEGKLDQAYVSSLAGFSARHAIQDRHVGGSQSARDVLSPLAQKKKGFRVRSANRPHDYYGLRPMICDKGKFTPADAAAFRMDFQSWLSSQCQRSRKIIGRFISGERPGEIADRFAMSRGRVSQLRHKFRREWEIFQGEAVGQA